jgi:prevent-host-death family protein
VMPRRSPAVRNIAAAKTELSALVERAHRGETIIIARNGVPRARLAPLEDDRRALRVPGKKIGGYTLAPDFDAPLSAEMIALFEGSDGETR